MTLREVTVTLREGRDALRPSSVRRLMLFHKGSFQPSGQGGVIEFDGGDNQLWWLPSPRVAPLR